MAGHKLEFDKLGIDVLLAGVQKCFALPPGLTVCAVSEKAMQKAATVPNRGLYFDFVDMHQFYLKNQTPSTPAVSLLQAFNKQMDDILAEGERRLANWRRAVRHATGPTATDTVARLRQHLADDLDTPKALAAVDAWTTSSETVPAPRPGPAATEPMPSRVVPAATAMCDAVVTATELDATAPTDRRPCAAANRSTANVSAPALALPFTEAETMSACDTLAAYRLNEPASASLDAATRKASTLVFSRERASAAAFALS